MKNKIQLHGFNNLTKTLSFNIYDICYAKSLQHKTEYIGYINDVYNADRLTKILQDVVQIIGATVLNIAYQDYEPQGSSVTMLIAEGEDIPSTANTESPGPMPETVLAHLDKSHITVHTYPESHPDNAISTFRADIDVSTCGVISPLKALNYLLHTFESDIATIDYRVRGFTRDINGRKHFIDHDINSIQNFMTDEEKNRYQMTDVNVYQENIFHTKLLLKEFSLDNYLFGSGEEDFSTSEKIMIRAALEKEMLEIYYGRNIL